MVSARPTIVRTWKIVWSGVHRMDMPHRTIISIFSFFFIYASWDRIYHRDERNEIDCMLCDSCSCSCSCCQHNHFTSEIRIIIFIFGLVPFIHHIRTKGPSDCVISPMRLASQPKSNRIDLWRHNKILIFNVWRRVKFERFGAAVKNEDLFEFGFVRWFRFLYRLGNIARAPISIHSRHRHAVCNYERLSRLLLLYIFPFFVSFLASAQFCLLFQSEKWKRIYFYFYLCLGLASHMASADDMHRHTIPLLLSSLSR